MKKYSYTEDELIALLSSEIKRLNNHTARFFNKYKLESVPSTTYFLNIFNLKWTQLLNMINITETNAYNISKEELISDIKNVMIKINKNNLSSIEYAKHGKYSLATIVLHFGCWNKMKKELNLKEWTAIRVSHTDAELIKQYIDYSLELGKKIRGASTKDLANSKLTYSLQVYLQRFGSISELKKRAGFIPREYPARYTKKDIHLLLKNEYLKNKGPLTYVQIKKHENLPTMSTIFAHFKSTNMKKVWDEIILDIQNDVPIK